MVALWHASVECCFQGAASEIAPNNALEDLKFAKDRKLQVIASFRNEYESVEDFEREIGVEVPPEIKRLLIL